MAANCQWTFLLKKAISVIYLLEIGLTFREKSLKIVLTEGWQSGNAPDSKSGEPANTGAQVQILYLPYITFHNRGENIDIGFITVHAQDHLMTTILLKDIINNLLDIYR